MTPFGMAEPQYIAVDRMSEKVSICVNRYLPHPQTRNTTHPAPFEKQKEAVKISVCYLWPRTWVVKTQMSLHDLDRANQTIFSQIPERSQNQNFDLFPEPIVRRQLPTKQTESRT